MPALIAARSDVVAVLAGRRGETKTAVWSPVLGGLMLTAGIAGAAYGALQPGSGELDITVAAILAVLGMVLLTPIVLGLLGRLARLLPLPARFAVRDAARHRSRTAPAVAAVAATVAGVVALGIGGTSDAAERQAMYTPTAPLGVGRDPGLRRRGSRPGRRSPAGRPPRAAGGARRPGSAVSTRAATSQLRIEPDSGSWAGALGSSVLVGPASLGALGLPADERRRARSALARRRGRPRWSAAPAAGWPGRAGPGVLRRRRHGHDARAPRLHRAVAVSAPGAMQQARAVLPVWWRRTPGLT